MRVEDLAYRHEGLNCKGYLAYDDAIAGKRPGILLVHEAPGLGANVMERTEKLAKLGYVAFAVDLYGERRQYSDMGEMMAQLARLQSDPRILRDHARTGLDVLAGLPVVDPARLGAMGFCMGGSTVLELARDGADVKAVVSFHGGLKTLKPAAPGTIKARILVCTGATDPLIPVEDVTAFQAEMSAAAADWQVTTYANTGHSFTNRFSDRLGIPGFGYHALSDQRSWDAMHRHFQEVF